MEHGTSSNIPYTDHLNQTIDGESYDDIMIRRMKNRERQRRYRARKRLEADTVKEITYWPTTPHESNASSMQMFTPITQELTHAANNRIKGSAEGQLVLARIEMPISEINRNVVTRVHSQRDWKRDARKAHSIAWKDTTSVSPVINGGISKDSPAETTAIVPHGGEMHKIGHGKRHWKAEARNRKT